MAKLLCLDTQPTFLNVFDFSVAPSLLFYSYIPIVIFLLFLSFWIAKKEKFSLKSKLLLSLGISFSLWVLNIIIQWVTVEADIVYFAWQITALLEILIPLSTVYLAYVFIDNTDVRFFLKSIFGLVVFIVAILLPTSFNMHGFDITNCEGLVGPLTYGVYGFEIFSVFWIFMLGVTRYNKFKTTPTEDKNYVPKLKLVTASSMLFLLIFSLSNIAGELTQTYSINLFGPIGMVVFLSIISYLIVKFQVFSVKVIAAQILVWSVTLLVGSQFFFIKNTTNYYLNSFAFIVIIILGNYLIKSVKTEVEQKEELQKLTLNLKNLIQQRESLVHLITHKVKGSFTRSKYIFAEMLEGSFGVLSPELKMITQKGLESDKEGIITIDLILNSFNLQTGNVKYDMKPVDLKEVVNKLLAEKKLAAEAKGLKLETIIPEGAMNILGDPFWLNEVVLNLVENSIRYTKSGTVTVILENKGDKIIFAVKDTGVGITEEDKKNLFTEGGRGKDSVKVNVDSTGYGLYSVKMIVEAHKGRLWAESEGQDKGSAFYVEFDALG